MPVSTAVLDACVLYSAPLRDLLMHMAVLDVFAARWTDAIHEEWIAGIMEQRPDLTKEQLDRTRQLMDENVRGCLVTGFEKLIESLRLPDADDRHVLAAAVECQADAIVTYNLKDFPDETLRPFGIRARHPDVFIAELLRAEPELVCQAVRRQRASLKRPPYSVEQLLDTLERQQLLVTVAELRTLQSRL